MDHIQRHDDAPLDDLERLEAELSGVIHAEAAPDPRFVRHSRALLLATIQADAPRPIHRPYRAPAAIGGLAATLVVTLGLAAALNFQTVSAPPTVARHTNVQVAPVDPGAKQALYFPVGRANVLVSNGN